MRVGQSRQHGKRDGTWRGRFGLTSRSWRSPASPTSGGPSSSGTVPRPSCRNGVPAVGRASTIAIRLRDPQSGLQWSRVELESAGKSVVLASESYPAASWRKSTVLDTTLSVPVHAADLGVAEGPATLRVYADDYSWMRWLRSARPILEQAVTVDLTPPTIEVLSTQHYVKLGGTDFMLYKASARHGPERRPGRPLLLSRHARVSSTIRRSAARSSPCRRTSTRRPRPKPSPRTPPETGAR